MDAEPILGYVSDPITYGIQVSKRHRRVRFNFSENAPYSSLPSQIWGFHAHLDTHSTNTWTAIPR